MDNLLRFFIHLLGIRPPVSPISGGGVPWQQGGYPSPSRPFVPGGGLFGQPFAPHPILTPLLGFPQAPDFFPPLGGSSGGISAGPAMFSDVYGTSGGGGGGTGLPGWQNSDRPRGGLPQPWFPRPPGRFQPGY